MHARTHGQPKYRMITTTNLRRRHENQESAQLKLIDIVMYIRYTIIT